MSRLWLEGIAEKDLATTGRVEKELAACEVAEGLETELVDLFFFPSFFSLLFLPAFFSPHPQLESLFTGY